VAKSYYELKEEEERLALMGGGYSPEEEAPIPSSLPSSVEASRRASGSRLNVLGESLAAAKRVEPRSAGEQARIDDINRRNAALTTNARYEAALNGENRGSGVLGFIGRRRLMNKRGEREPGLREMYTEKSRLADEQTVMAERRKGYQEGKVAKAEFLAKYGAEAAQAVTAQENAVTNAATATEAAIAAAEQDQINNERNSARDSREVIAQNTAQQGLQSYLTRQESLAENIKKTYSSLNGMNDFVATAKDAAAMGGPEGKLAAPIIGIQQLFTSLGVDWGRSGLNSEILTSKSAKLVLDSIMEQEGGMKGVTEPELLILANSLPNMSTSHEARIAIAEILQGVKKRQLRADLLDYNQFSGDESWRGESHMPIRNYKEMMLSTYTQEEIEEAKARLMRGRQ
tara:strand:- start:391 stop:1593 length:1203 start_codon:yes stop_codon:yes gene_type:complete